MGLPSTRDRRGSRRLAGLAAHFMDTRCDVYALGVIRYELLCDRFPLEVEHLSPMELPRAVIESAPVRPRVAMPSLPRPLEAIMLKAMAKSPEDRYQSAADLERDLGRYLRDEPVEARNASLLDRTRLLMRRHRALVAAGVFAAAAGVVALAVSVGFAITAMRAERRASAERDLALQRQYFADLAAAESALRANEFGRLRTHLADAPADLRGWEWSYLQQRSEPSSMVIERPVIADAVAVDGARGVFLCGGRDGTIGVWPLEGGAALGELAVGGRLIIDLWDARSGASLGTLEGHPDEQIFSLLHTSDGRLLLSDASDGSIAVWDLASGRRVETLRGHQRSVWALALNEDGTLLASASIDQTSRLWSTLDWTPRGVLHGHGDAVADVAFLPTPGEEPHDRALRGSSPGAASPLHGRLLTCSWDRSIRVWDLGRRDEALLPQAVRESIDRLAITSDGRLLVAARADQPGSATGRVVLHDAVTLEPIGRIEHPRARPRPIAISPDGRSLAIGWTDGVVTLDDLRTGARVVSFEAHPGGVLSLCFDRAGTRLSSGGRGREVRLWSVTSEEPADRIETDLASVNGIFASNDGSMLAFTSTDGSAMLWSLRHGRSIARLRGHLLAIYGATFSPDDRQFLTGSRDQTVRVWDTATGALERVLEGHGQWVTALAYTPDRTRLVSSSWFETLTLWDARLLEPIVSLRGHRRPVRSLAIDPAGDAIFTGDDDGHLLVWDRRERAVREDARRRAAREAEEAEPLVDSLLERRSALDAAQAIEQDVALAPGIRRAALNELLRRGLGGLSPKSEGDGGVGARTLPRVSISGP